MGLAICLNAAIILEQPAQSFLEYYPRFREFLQKVQTSAGKPCAARMPPGGCHKVGVAVAREAPQILPWTPELVESMIKPA